MTLSADETQRMTALLEELKWFQRRVAGGEDMEAGVACCQLQGKIRSWLRDSPAMIAHLTRVLTTPEVPKPIKRR